MVCVAIILVFVDLHTIATVMLSFHSLCVLLIQVFLKTNEDVYTVLFGVSLLTALGLGVIAKIYAAQPSRATAIFGIFIALLYFFNCNALMWLILGGFLVLHMIIWYLISHARYPNNTKPEKIELRLFEIPAFFIPTLFVSSTVLFSYPLQIFNTLSTGSFYPKQPWHLDSSALLITASLGVASLACHALVSSSIRKQAILELPMSVEEPNMLISNLV